jgi:glycosyltransferase involved in cell wall biosynthesis
MLGRNVSISTPAKRINYILYSETADHNLAKKLGCAEYSYFFVREAFRALLEPHAATIVVTNPEKEVDAIYDKCLANGEDCIFLSFAPPHRSFVSLRCPAIPVFAWEFDTIPSEEWASDNRNDWRKVLTRFGRAITHSRYSAKAIRDALGPDFPVEAIPAPVWDRARKSAEAFVDGTDIEIPARYFLDSRLSHTLAVPFPAGGKPRGLIGKWRRSLLKRVGRTPLANRLPEPPVELLRFAASEVIYTSVFNPYDGRKNWQDMLSAFCITCAKWPEATLVFKLVHFDSSWALNDMRAMLARFPMFQCRVVVICDFLDKLSYQKLIFASKFAVNTSLGEGQCLPLMEAMSWGKPILAPGHTSMSEYLNETVGFAIETSLEPCSWPHDPRAAIRAYRHRVNWASVARAFADSFKMARTEPQRYAEMSAAAIEMQRQFCSEELAFEKLGAFVRTAVADSSLKRTGESIPQFSLPAFQDIAYSGFEAETKA